MKVIVFFTLIFTFTLTVFASDFTDEEQERISEQMSWFEELIDIKFNLKAVRGKSDTEEEYELKSKACSKVRFYDVREELGAGTIGVSLVSLFRDTPIKGRLNLVFVTLDDCEIDENNYNSQSPYFSFLGGNFHWPFPWKSNTSISVQKHDGQLTYIKISYIEGRPWNLREIYVECGERR